MAETAVWLLIEESAQIEYAQSNQQNIDQHVGNAQQEQLFNILLISSLEVSLAAE